jgi:hypothetical protein
VESLNKASGSRLEENWYVFNHADEAITAELGVDLSRKYLRLGDRKIFWEQPKSLQFSNRK